MTRLGFIKILGLSSIVPSLLLYSKKEQVKENALLMELEKTMKETMDSFRMDFERQLWGDSNNPIGECRGLAGL